MRGAAPLRVLQITDTHLKARGGATLLGVDTAATLQAVLDEALGEQQPDALLASGDLAHDPEPAAYRRFATQIRAAFNGPVLCLPGNHDGSAAMAALWEAEAAPGWQPGAVSGAVADRAGKVPYPASLVLGSWEIIGVDTHQDHRAEAAFDDAARAALRQHMRRSQAGYLLLACHHPPLPVGCPWLDKDCIPGGAELLESCAADGRVRGLVFGHVHQQVEDCHGALAVLGTPSTCFQFEPGSRTFAIDRSADSGRPGYRWLELGADGSFGSRVGRLPGFTLNIDLSDRS